MEEITRIAWLVVLLYAVSFGPVVYCQGDDRIPQGAPTIPEFNVLPTRTPSVVTPGKLPAGGAEGVTLKGHLVVPSNHVATQYFLFLIDSDSVVYLPEQPRYASASDSTQAGNFSNVGDLIEVSCDYLIPASEDADDGDSECVGMSIASFVEAKTQLPTRISATGEQTTNYQVKMLAVRLTTTCSGRSQTRTEASIRSVWGATGTQMERCSYGSMTMPLLDVISVGFSDSAACTALSQCDYWTIASKAWTNAKAALGSSAASKYTHWSIIMPSSACDSSFAALGMVGGAYDRGQGRPVTTWYTPSNFGSGRVATVMQEVFHNFGLIHSSVDTGTSLGVCLCHFDGSANCNRCAHQEYGDYSTCMGYGDFCLNAPEAYRLGWTQALGIMTSTTGAGQRKSYTVPALTRSSTNVVIVKPNWLPSSSYYYNMYFSTRDNTGGDAGMYSEFQNRINVHVVDRTVDDVANNNNGDMHLLELIPANSRKVYSTQKLVVETGAVASDRSIPITICRYASSATECDEGAVTSSPPPSPSTVNSPPPDDEYSYPPSLTYPPYDYEDPPSEDEKSPPPPPRPPSPSPPRPPSPSPPRPPSPSPPPPPLPPVTDGDGGNFTYDGFLPTSVAAAVTLSPLSLFSIYNVALIDDGCKMGGQTVSTVAPGLDCRLFQGSPVGGFKYAGESVTSWIAASFKSNRLYMTQVELRLVGGEVKARAVVSNWISQKRTLAALDEYYVNSMWKRARKGTTASGWNTNGWNVATMSYMEGTSMSIGLVLGRTLGLATALRGVDASYPSEVQLTDDKCFMGGKSVSKVSPGKPCRVFRGNAIGRLVSTDSVAQWIAVARTTWSRIYMVQISIAMKNGVPSAWTPAAGYANWKGDVATLDTIAANTWWSKKGKSGVAKSFTAGGAAVAGISYSKATEFFEASFVSNSFAKGTKLEGLGGAGVQSAQLLDDRCYLGGRSVSTKAPGGQCRMFNHGGGATEQNWLAVYISTKNRYYITRLTIQANAEGMLIAYVTGSRWNGAGTVKLPAVTEATAATWWSTGKNSPVAVAFGGKGHGLASFSYAAVDTDTPPCVPLGVSSQCINIPTGSGFAPANPVWDSDDGEVPTADACADYCAAHGSISTPFAYAFSPQEKSCSCAMGPDTQMQAPGFESYIRIC